MWRHLVVRLISADLSCQIRKEKDILLTDVSIYKLATSQIHSLKKNNLTYLYELSNSILTRSS